SGPHPKGCAQRNVDLWSMVRGLVVEQLGERSCPVVSTPFRKDSMTATESSSSRIEMPTKAPEKASHCSSKLSFRTSLLMVTGTHMPSTTHCATGKKV